MGRPLTSANSQTRSLSRLEDTMRSDPTLLDPKLLREKAARLAEMARSIGDAEAAARLIERAELLERVAASIEGHRS